MRVQRYCFFLNEPNFFITFASKLTNYMRFMAKQLSFLMVVAGILALAASVVVEWADANSTRLVGLVLTIGGAIAHIYFIKRESRY